TRIQKLISLIPFLIVCGCVVASWVDFLFNGYAAEPAHYLALGLVAVNAVVYFIRFRVGIWMTGGILLVGIANVVSFTAAIATFTVFGSPSVGTWSFLIMIVYGVIDFGVYGHEFFKRGKGEPAK